ncbi:hypothetical protein BDV32DRAFT_152068 [Aspergillus pseudonomiae]|nr:hypothetical protein BDV32DRAFT_152068 [Aspergillus pseudonomiae]
MVRQVDYGLYRYNNVPLKLLGLQSRDHSGKDNEQLFLQQGTANTINIVRVEPDGFLPCIDKYGLDKTLDRATTIVDGSAELQRYISLVANKVDVKTLSETDESGAGSFIPVLPFQQQCLVPVERVSTERHTISHETRLKRKAAEIFGLLRPSASDTETDPTEYKAEDEAIVNKALILFLETGLNLAGPLLVGWALKQFQFSPRFNKEHYITFTDGDLWDAITRRIYVIIELKKHQFRLNTAKRIKIPMQELAQSLGLLKRNEEDSSLFKNQSVIALY